MNQTNVFPEIKKNFGFGCMRLPMVGDQVDLDHFSRMIDQFFDAGFNYFDTAHPYLEGKSETAIRACLTSRYPRESYVLTNKLSGNFFKTQSDIIPLFESQLAACGVDYFDFYLMHALNAERYDFYTRCRAFETAMELKQAGRIRHLGISFHDQPEVLERILTEHPEIEVVQIQFNYVDYDDPTVRSRACYDVCRKFSKPVIVMEPVKGGSLVNLPDQAQSLLRALGGGSPASYAIRFAAGFDGMVMVLSGMSNTEQMLDNISYMKDFHPLSGAELDALSQVKQVLFSEHLIGCTACRYCTEGCPQQIPIPDLFGCMNSLKRGNGWMARQTYGSLTEKGGKASSCIKCGKCEKACPQHLKIRALLEAVAEEFEKA